MRLASGYSGPFAPHLVQVTADNKQLRKDLQQAATKVGKLQYRVDHLKDVALKGDADLIDALTAQPEHQQKLLKKFENLLKVRKLPNGGLEAEAFTSTGLVQ